METRTCKTCGLEKSLTVEFFNQDYNKKNGIKIPYWARACKVCTNKDDLVKNRKYKQNNRNKLSDSQKIYHQNHKDSDSNTKKIWYQNNQESIVARVSKNHKRRMQEDPLYKLRNRVSISVNYALKKAGSSKNGNSILDFLPYSIEELKEYLEKLFEPWMTWNNYGQYKIEKWDDNDKSTWKWNIDHIIPHSTFKYSSMNDLAFKECWALSNLRPYSAKQNTIDGDRR